MARKTTSAASAVEETTVETTAEATSAEETAAEVTQERKFPIKRLATYCQKLFGVPSSTFAGATAGMTGEYSISEIKEVIEEWKGRRAK